MNMQQLINAAKENYDVAVNMASMFLTGEIEPNNPGEVLMMFEAGQHWLEKATQAKTTSEFPDLVFLSDQKEQLIRLVLTHERRFLSYVETFIGSDIPLKGVFSKLANALEAHEEASAEWKKYREA